MAKWLSYTYTYIHSFLESFSIWAIAENWVEFLELYRRFLLVIYFIYSSVYMSIPISQFIHLPWKQWQTIFLGSKITADGDCSHEIKRHLLLGRKAITNLSSVQLLSHVRLFAIPWTLGLPVHHQLLKLAQIHVHRVSDAIQSSHPLSPPYPAFNVSQYQGLF